MCLEEAKAEIEVEPSLEENEDALARILTDLSKVYVKLGMQNEASAIIPISSSHGTRMSIPFKKTYSMIQTTKKGSSILS